KDNDRKPKNASVFKNLFKIHWMLLAILLCSMTVAGVNVLIIQPQLKRYEELRIQKENLDSIYLRIRSTDIEKALTGLTARVERNEILEKNFTAKIAEKKNLSAVLSEVNWIVNKSGVQLNAIDPLPEEGKILGKYIKQPIVIRFQGNYSKFLIFLKNLETARYWLLIDSYKINYNSHDPSNLVYNVTVYCIMS
ncbi:MAG: type 4a pilus biogenesis protein PilO, partial [Candidatus Marinimicrobia bacterium]|nr:type 4a pilus biogenesis protein PilO [Candidatus Neomarinimicrobiota bacterium]